MCWCLFFRDTQRDCVLWWLMGYTSCTKLLLDPVRKSWWREPMLLSLILTLVSNTGFVELIMKMDGCFASSGLTAISLFRDVSFRDVFQLHSGRSVHRAWRATIIRWPSVWCRQSVHHPGGRWCFPNRAGQCECFSVCLIKKIQLIRDNCYQAEKLSMLWLKDHIHHSGFSDTAAAFCKIANILHWVEGDVCCYCQITTLTAKHIWF